ncbi:hypothetical protein KCU71_g8376, partial [Aureobasidium melanogenum]
MAFFLPFIPFVVERFSTPAAPDLPPPKPYQQPSNNIPHLFTAQQEQCSTIEWYHKLSSSSETYKNCRVISMTLAKALRSPLSHEFVQFIVEDSSTGTRTRVFTDRIDSSPPDRVIVGRDWASPKNPSDQDDMPMPLMSLSFTNQPFPVIQLAALMAAITEREPEYHFYSTMCWWYAMTVFKSAMMYAGDNCEVKEWKFAKYASSMVVWDGIITPREQMEMEAHAFKRQDIEGMSWQVNGDAVPKWTTDRYLKTVTEVFENETAREEYEEAMQINPSQKMDFHKVDSFLTVIKEAPKEDVIDSVPTSADYNKATAAFIQAMLNEPDARKNQEAFEEAWQKQQQAAHPEEGIKYIRQKELYWGPKADQRRDFDRSIECFVGGVLRRMNEAKV